MNFIIKTVYPKDKKILHQAAEMLVDSFKEMAPKSWPDMKSAVKEVKECLEQGMIFRGAIDRKGQLLGWIGGRSEYHGRVWELHPMVVNRKFWRKGVGSALLRDFENQVRKKGGLTIFLGTDDENNLTSLTGKDLYKNTWKEIRNIKNYRNHPYEFYMKAGYTIVGVMPDANGRGKPDIFMAKKVR